MRFQISSNPAKECFTAEVAAQHSDHRAPLEITDMVENLINLKGIPYRHLNGMRCAKRVKLECLLNTFGLQIVSLLPGRDSGYMEGCIPQIETKYSTLHVHVRINAIYRARGSKLPG